MATDIYSDDNGNRKVIRHKGPAGPGLIPGGTTGQIYVKASDEDYDGTWANPPNGTGAAVGPSSATDGAFVLFDGTTGKLLKDSTYTVSYFAPRTLVDSKVDAVVGKGLSTNDFTDEYKAQLDDSVNGNFFGTFATLEDLEDAVDPPVAGNYAFVEVSGSTLVIYFWDDTNDVWTTTNEGTASTGSEIANLLFESTSAALWDKDDSFVFTSTYRDAVDNSVSQEFINSVLTNAGIQAASYGAVSYFDLTGTSIAISGVSDGSTNLVKADVVTTTNASVSSFDEGSSTARLRYVATGARLFRVDCEVSLSGAAVGLVVLAIAKNGAPVASSRQIVHKPAGSVVVMASVSELVSLSPNDYVELFVGNTTDTGAVQIHALKIVATTA